MDAQISPSAYEHQGKDTAGDLSHYLQVIFHEKKTIFIICSAFFLISSVFLSFLPNSYEAEVQILVEQLGDMEKLAPQMVSSNFRGEDDYYGTQVAIITGKKISSRVETELGITGGYKLTARRLRGTRIISVGVKSRRPQLAAKMANKTIDVYIQEKAQDDLFIAKQVLKWLPSQVEQMSLGGELSGLEKTEKKGSSELLLPAEAEDPAYQQLRQSRMETESKLSELSFRYKSSHPVMKELTEKLSYLDKQLQERKNALVGNLKSSLMGDFHLTNIKVLSPASVPLKAAGPKRLQGIFLATSLGFFISICFVVYIEQTDPRVWYENDVRRALDIPFMGYIPLIASLAARKDKKNKLKGIHATFSDDLRLQNLIKSVPTLGDAAAFMRTHLFFSVPQQKSKILIMTSTTPNEGKSTVMGLFALSLTSLGKKILVIDADLRRPYLHTHLGLKNERGLSEYLSGESEYRDIIQSVPDSALKMITGGVLKANSAQLLSSSPRFKTLLETISEEYDYILIDAPPILYIPDGLIIAKHVQGVVLVAGAGMIRRQVLQAVKHKFDAINRPVIGVVINRANYSMDFKFQKYFKQYKDYYYNEIPTAVLEEKTEKP